jgi:hypothetical protein
MKNCSDRARRTTKNCVVQGLGQLFSGKCCTNTTAPSAGMPPNAEIERQRRPFEPGWQ